MISDGSSGIPSQPKNHEWATGHYRDVIYARGHPGRPPWSSTCRIREASRMESSLGPADELGK